MKKISFIFTLFVSLFCMACNEDEPIQGGEQVGGSTTIYPSGTEELPKGDGDFVYLQKATKGQGINLVLMGDGYTEADIQSGLYADDIKQIADFTFALEPMKSLREYFNVAMVYVESKDNSFDGTSGIMCTINSSSEQFYYTADDIARVEGTVDTYASVVPGLSKSNTVYGVICNTTQSAGITHTPGRTINDFEDFRAYAYCTKYNEYGYDMKVTWIHEFVGHAFAKLEDEYGWTSCSSSEQDTYRNFVAMAHHSGWAVNVSTEQDVTKSPWADLAADERYASENLGCYYGARSYNKVTSGRRTVAPNFYNPSWDNYNDYYYNSPSIMGNTYAETVTFNAPCRRAIYSWVMKLGEGKDITNEDFVAFDLK